MKFFSALRWWYGAVTNWPLHLWIRLFPELRRRLNACSRARWQPVNQIPVPEKHQAGQFVRLFHSWRFAGPSNPHGHHDVAVFVLAIGSLVWPELAGRLGIFEFEADISGAYHLQEFQQVLRIEADHHGIAVVAGFNGIFRFANFGVGGRDLQFILLQTHTDGIGALIGKLGHSLDGTGKFVAMYGHRLVIVAWQDCFVIRELSSELAGRKDARAQAEK